MKILYIGDIMAEPGISIVSEVLPGLKREQEIDFVVAQSENVSNGKGMAVADMKRLQLLGVDFFTGGNHTTEIEELNSLLQNPDSPVIGPANMPNCPGQGWKYHIVSGQKICVVSIMGSKVGKEIEMTNPLQRIDQILPQIDDDTFATIVNFHGDYSSEKRIFGYYLDGKVTAVVGDHWHVSTSDAMILPNGTAHITDVGMCGSLHSSLGVTLDSVIPRWKDGVVNKNELATKRPYQFNAVIIDVADDGVVNSIEQIQKIVD
ncbi:YmdB family metallophosphoesterase [Candidatus Saccharibacteria bacterium]|nr:YmdB family metallophosphoesterase [Candidatus Saccharibacteria bacterium]